MNRLQIVIIEHKTDLFSRKNKANYSRSKWRNKKLYLDFLHANSTQWWKDVELGPPDIILGIFEAFKVDTNPHKIDLSVGAYRDELGRPYVLSSILKAEQRIVDQRQDKQGDSDIGSEYFRDVTFRLAVGDKLFDRPHVSAQVSFLSSRPHDFLCIYDRIKHEVHG